MIILSLDRYIPPHQRDSGRDDRGHQRGGYSDRRSFDQRDMRYDGERKGSYDGRRYDDRRGSGRDDRRASDYGRHGNYDDRRSDYGRHGNYDDRRSYGHHGDNRSGSDYKGDQRDGEINDNGTTEETDGPKDQSIDDTDIQKNAPERSYSQDAGCSKQSPVSDRWAQLDLDRRFSTPTDSDHRQDKGGRYGYERRGTFPNFSGKPDYQQSVSENFGGSYGRGRSDWGIPLPRNERVERYNNYNSKCQLIILLLFLLETYLVVTTLALILIAMKTFL